jgi:Fe-S-cluster containining protein
MKALSMLVFFQSITVAILIVWKLAGEKTKIGRFINAFGKKKHIRLGTCNPNECSTIDGRKGSACCKLGYICPALRKTGNCGIYSARPINCRVFPNSPADLKLVKNCSYKFI